MTIHVPTRTLDWLERRQGQILAALVAAVVALFVVANSCHAQVASTPTFARGALTTVVRNPSPDTLTVTAELRWAHVDAAGRVVLDSAVAALVSPAAFTLPPGEAQTVRVKLRAPVPPGTTLRLVWTFDPPEASAAAAGTATAARLVVRTVLVTKALVP